MSRKSILIICVGLLLMITTIIVFSVLINSVSLSGTERIDELVKEGNQTATTVLERTSDEVRNYRICFWIIIILMVIFTIYFAIFYRHSGNQN